MPHKERETADMPEYVANFPRPPKTSIKHIKGGWYLYAGTTHYDPVAHKSITAYDRYLGKITEDGLREPVRRKTGQQPPKAGSVAGVGTTATGVGTAGPDGQREDSVTESSRTGNAVHLPLIQDIPCSDVVSIGAVEYLYSLTGRVRENLKACFPSCWREIYSAAMVRAIAGQGGRLCRVDEQFKESALSYLYPGLAFRRDEMGGFLGFIGMQRDTIVRYMNMSVGGDEKYLLVDGHRIITLSRNLPTAKKGYDTRNRFQPQINVMYIYALDGEGYGYPAYYKKYSGNIPDVSAMESLMSECEKADASVTAIGDKGTGSGPVFDYLEGSGRKYIFAVKRGCSALKGKIPDIGSYEGMFVYHDRAILWHEVCDPDGKAKYILYRDITLLASELATCCKRATAKCEDSIEALSNQITAQEKAVSTLDARIPNLEERLSAARQKQAAVQTCYDTAAAALAEAEEKVRSAEQALERKRSRASKAKGTENYSERQRLLEKGEDALAGKRKVLDARKHKLDTASEALQRATDAVQKKADSVEIARKDLDEHRRTLAALQDRMEEQQAILFGDPDEPGSDCNLAKYGYTEWKGTFTLKTNIMDIPPLQAFIAYKQRPSIEGYFKIYDNTMRFDSSYVQSEPKMEGWLFLNHLSATMAVLAMDDVARHGLTSEISFVGLMASLSSIRARRVNGTWQLEPIDSKLAELCASIHFTPGKLQV